MELECIKGPSHRDGGDCLKTYFGNNVLNMQDDWGQRSNWMDFAELVACTFSQLAIDGAKVLMIEMCHLMPPTVNCTCQFITISSYLLTLSSVFILYSFKVMYGRAYFRYSCSTSRCCSSGPTLILHMLVHDSLYHLPPGSPRIIRMLDLGRTPTCSKVSASS